MFRYLALIVLAGCGIASGASTNKNADDLFGRIVNGEDTSITAHPYQISLQVNGGHYCGGSLINEDTVVTAAHCLQKYKAYEYMVRLGSTDFRSGGEMVEVKTFRNHPDYNSTSSVYDVGVIKLATPVRQTANVRYISLAKETPKTGTPAVVSGWGSKCFLFCAGSNTLQMVQVFIVDEEDCASDTYNYGDKIKPTMVCAYDIKKDACQGDSGGPLVANAELVGVVSWGNGCAWEGYPGVYCDVPSVRNWILKTAQEL